MSTTESDLERMLFDETAEPTALPLALLSEITDGFSDKLVIGRGGFAVVYKAMLEKGDVAVKRLPYMYEKDFEREVKCLMKVRHKNIVRLLGYCSDTQGNVGSYNGELFMADKMERLLCFEYLPKGSLRDYIKDGSDGLGWPKSYKIIRGICEGLHYLHHKNIMHLDLKPENILLDNNMVPKITDFGISRCFQEGQTRANLTVVGGTLGYLPPESFTSTEITNKHDLYSLGVIIMEILTGKKEDQAVDDVLNSWINRLKTSQGNQDYEQIRVCAEIGMECMHFNPEKRPVSMKHIMDRLSEIDDTEVFLAEPRQLLDVHPLKLCFPFEPNKLISSPLQLTNNTFEHLAFRLIEKSGNCFLRQPLYGIVPARSSYTLVVTTEKKTEQTKMINSDLTLESSNLGDERIQAFESQLGCDSFFKQVKETKNVVQEVILEAVYTPWREMIPSTKIISIMDAPRKREIFSLDTNQEKQWIITGEEYGHIGIWNYETQRKVESIRVPNTNAGMLSDDSRILSMSRTAVNCVKFIARMQWFVAGTDEGYIHVFNFETKMQQITSFKAADRSVDSLAVHPTKPYLLSTDSREMKLWNWDKGWNCAHIFYTHDHIFKSQVVFSPKGATIATTAHRDFTVKVWNFDSTKFEYSLYGHSKRVNCLDFFTCHEQEYLVTGSDDQTAKIWNVQKKIVAHTLDAFMSPVMSVLYQPNLQILFTGLRDGSVYLWSTNNSRAYSRPPRLDRIINIGFGGAVHALRLSSLTGMVVIAKEDAVAIMYIDNVNNYQEESTDYCEPHLNAYWRPGGKTTSEAIAGSSGELPILDAHPLELHFPSEPNDSICSTLHLTNKTFEHIAFRLINKSDKARWRLGDQELYGIVPTGSTYTLIVATAKEMKLPNETDFDVVLQTSTSGDRYMVLFASQSECDGFFEEAKEMENVVHEVALKVVYAPSQGDTTLEPTILPQIKIISLKTNVGYLNCIDAHPTDPWIITCHAREDIRIWNYNSQDIKPRKIGVGDLYFPTKKPLDSFKISRYVCSIKFIARKQWVVIGTCDGYIYVYKCARATQMKEIKRCMVAYKERIDSLAVHPIKPHVLFEPHKLWDWNTDKVDGEGVGFTYESGKLRSVILNPEDPNSFAYAFGDIVTVSSIDSRESQFSLSGHSGKVNCLDFFTRDNQHYLITGSDDYTAKIWDLQKKTCIHTLDAIMSPVNHVISLPGRPYLVTGSKHGTVQVWSSIDFRLERTVNFGGGGPVRGLVCVMGSRKVVIGQEYAISIMDIDGEKVDSSNMENEKACASKRNNENSDLYLCIRWLLGVLCRACKTWNRWKMV